MFLFFFCYEVSIILPPGSVLHSRARERGGQKDMDRETVGETEGKRKRGRERDRDIE